MLQWVLRVPWLPAGELSQVRGRERDCIWFWGGQVKTAGDHWLVSQTDAMKQRQLPGLYLKFLILKIP